MKKTIITASLLLAALMFQNCSGSEKKVENAAENVAEAQEDLNKAEQKFDEEWANFRMESEQKIKENEVEIEKCREKAKSDKSYSQKHKEKIDELEKKNVELKDKIETYNSTKTKDNWAEFKREFNHDMNELGTALKDFGKNNEN